jgi:hypothetical protein
MRAGSRVYSKPGIAVDPFLTFSRTELSPNFVTVC